MRAGAGRRLWRLHHANDALTELVREMRDAMKSMETEHAAEMRRLKGDLVPGFSWPDRDRSAKAAKLEAEPASVTAERDRLQARCESRNLTKRPGCAETGSNANGDMKGELEGLPAYETAAEALVDFGDQITKIYHQGARATQHTFEQPCGGHRTFEHHDEIRQD